MSRKHFRHKSCQKIGIPVTAVNDPLPQRFGHAVFTDVVVPKKQTIGTHHTEIVQTLNDGDPFVPTGVIDRRGQHKKDIVEMDNIRMKTLDLVSYGSIGKIGPIHSEKMPELLPR
jgi:hypothetical protein